MPSYLEIIPLVSCTNLPDFMPLIQSARHFSNLLDYCKTQYYHAPFNFTHFALGDDNAYITGVQNSISMPHLVVIQLMRVIKWPRSDSDCSCVNKKGRGYKGFYSM